MRTEQPRRKDIGAIFRDGRAIDRALNKAFHLAIEAHRRAGQPLVVCRNGRVVKLPAPPPRPTRAAKTKGS
jgi:hypothetical protein